MSRADTFSESTAWQLAEPRGASRSVIVRIRDGTLVGIPAPPPGSASNSMIAAVERHVSSSEPLRVLVIAETGHDTRVRSLTAQIPFLGYLLGLAYLGHRVLVLSLDPDLLTSATHRADLLLVDGGLIANIDQDLLNVLLSQVREHRAIVYNRDGTTRLLSFAQQ